MGKAKSTFLFLLLFSGYSSVALAGKAAQIPTECTARQLRLAVNSSFTMGEDRITAGVIPLGKKGKVVVGNSKGLLIFDLEDRAIVGELEVGTPTTHISVPTLDVPWFGFSSVGLSSTLARNDGSGIVTGVSHKSVEARNLVMSPDGKTALVVLPNHPTDLIVEVEPYYDGYVASGAIARIEPGVYENVSAHATYLHGGKEIVYVIRAKGGEYAELHVFNKQVGSTTFTNNEIVGFEVGKESAPTIQPSRFSRMFALIAQEGNRIRTSIYDVPDRQQRGETEVLKKVAMFVSNAESGWVPPIEFLESGLVLKGMYDGKIEVIDPATSKTKVILDGHKKSPVTKLTSSTDGKWYASAARNGTVAVWGTHEDNHTDLILPDNVTISDIHFIESDGKTETLLVGYHENGAEGWTKFQLVPLLK